MIKLEANIIQEIIDSFYSDDFDIDDQAESLLRQWEEFTPEQKQAVDQVLVCICGWSMQSLIERCNPIKGGK